MARARVNLPELIASLGPIGPEQFTKLLSATSWSPRYLRKKLIELGHPMEAAVEGVRQDSEGHLERTLSSLSELYSENPQLARQLVLESRRHLNFALRRSPEDPMKQFTLLHLRTWLENPPVYPVWLRLRKKKTPDSEPGVS